MSSSYTDIEERYVRLIYFASPKGDESLFAAAVLKPSASAERDNLKRLFAMNPSGALDIQPISEDVDLNTVVHLADCVSAKGIGVKLLSDARGAKGGDYLRVSVMFPWLEASYDTGYVARMSTVAIAKGVASDDVTFVARTTTLTFDSALGVSNLTFELRKVFGSPPAAPPVDITGAVVGLIPPASIEILVNGSAIARLSFAAESESAKKFRTELSRMVLAMYAATRIVCTVASLRIFRAAAAARSVAFAIGQSTSAEIDDLFVQASSKLHTAAGIKSECFHANNYILGFAERDAKLFIGESLYNELSRSANAVNVVTPLRRIAENSASQRESERDYENRVAQWRERLSKSIDIASTKESDIRDRIPSLGLDYEKLGATIVDVVLQFPQAGDRPSEFAEEVYKLLRERFEGALRNEAREFARGPLKEALERCKDAGVAEASAVQSVVSLFDADRTRANQLALIYMIAVASPEQPEFVSVAEGVELGAQLRRIRDCAKIDAQLARFKGAIENDDLYRETMRGAYDRASLREAVLRALPENAKALAAGMRAVAGIARSLSALLRRYIYIAVKTEPLADVAVADVDFVKQIDAEIRSELLGIARDAFSDDRIEAVGDIKDEDLRVPRMAILESIVRIVEVRISGLITKIENSAFDAVSVLPRRSQLSPEESRSRYLPVLQSLRGARVYAQALRTLYDTGTAPDVSGEADILPEDDIELLVQSQRVERAVVESLNAQLTKVVGKAEALAPPELKQMFNDTLQRISRVRSSLSSVAFVNRVLPLLGKLRVLVLKYVHGQSTIDKDIVDDTLDWLLFGMQYLHSAGYLASVERTLAQRRGDDEQKIKDMIEEPLASNERILARVACDNRRGAAECRARSVRRGTAPSGRQRWC